MACNVVPGAGVEDQDDFVVTDLRELADKPVS